MISPTLIVIPARWGSKGIHHKNAREVGGISLLLRATSTARKAADFLKGTIRVVVSTESPALAVPHTVAGVDILQRPAHLATDEATSEAVIAHVLDSLPGYEHVILMQCTSPFTTDEDLLAVIVALKSYTAVFTARRGAGFVWDYDCEPIGHDARRRLRRQDREVCTESGALYGVRVDAFQRSGSRFGDGTRGMLLHEHAWQALEVDDEADLICASALAAFYGA